MRLDNYLVENNLCESRNKAQTIIKEGLVSVNGIAIQKTSHKIENGDSIEIVKHKQYVSRAAFKLVTFLDEIKLDVKDEICLDIGSSTGGFTQVLLESGVKEVTCVDVGTDQLHKSLREDTRVNVFEGCDIRNFQSEKRFSLVVSDVAFISLHNILDDVDRLASNKVILLFKPQFEVGREAKRDKNGVVMDQKAILRSMEKFEEVCKDKSWNLITKLPSQITGKEGNLEYCYYYEK